MGKRSSFKRHERDYYPTPYEAVVPLLRHLDPGTRFIEPCVGDGRLIHHLQSALHICVGAGDITEGVDARMAGYYGIEADCFITNPPWARDHLHEIIVNLSDQLPTWLLFDSDWKHTRQAAPHLSRLRRIVSVGRVRWIAGSKHTGKDNCCWYLFHRPGNALPEFYGRAA
jgi:hypothetical protein